MEDPNLEIEVPEWIKVVMEVLRDSGKATKNHRCSDKEAWN